MTKDARKKKLLWPEGEMPCIWMEAGIIDYKLCDRNFDCENCPFDAIIRRGKDLSHEEEQKKPATPFIASPARREDRGGAPQSLADVLQLPDVKRNRESYYGFSYWYVVPKSAKDVVLGLNRLAVKLLPTIKDIILPNPNATIKKGKILCWFILNEGALCLLSPVDGIVQRLNEEAVSQLENKNDSDGVWLVKVHAEDFDLKGMLRAEEAGAFLQAQRSHTLDMLSSYMAEYHADLGQTLQDGGVRVDDLEEMIGPKKYFEFLTNIFNNNLLRG